jgi:ABC-type dipeptide/oligopeptide/nickel transport system permease subunit
MRTLFRKRAAKVGLAIVLVFVALMLVGPFISPYSPYATSSAVDSPPSLAHPFGTDYQGKDILSQLVWGSYASMFVGVAAAVGAVAIGSVVGLLAGYFSRAEGVLTGVTDIVMIFPAVPLLVLLGTLRPADNLYLIVILSVVLWPPVARSVRSQVLSIKSLPYVELAKMSGMSDAEVIVKVIIPAVGAIIFAYFVLTVAASIVLVMGLEYLGVGNPDVVSWGSMIYWSQQFGFYSGDWWWVLAPGVAISLLTVGFALMGYSFEEVMNPRLRT